MTARHINRHITWYKLEHNTKVDTESSPPLIAFKLELQLLIEGVQNQNTGAARSVIEGESTIPD